MGNSHVIQQMAEVRALTALDLFISRRLCVTCRPDTCGSSKRYLEEHLGANVWLMKILDSRLVANFFWAVKDQKR